MPDPGSVADDAGVEDPDREAAVIEQVGCVADSDGSADLIVEGGVPQGNPADFVKLSVTEIRRGD